MSDEDAEDARRSFEDFEVDDYDAMSSCVLNAYLSGAPLEQILETFLFCESNDEFTVALDALVWLSDLVAEHYE